MLTEDCYTSQKTYRLLLSKYLTSLRQANTKDMVRVCVCVHMLYVIYVCEFVCVYVCGWTYTVFGWNGRGG